MKFITTTVYLSIVIFYAFCLFPKTINAQCDPVADRAALIEFYQATDGPNWTNTWDLDAPMSEWYGVSLNNEGCVKTLDLDGKPEGFFNLSNTTNGNNLSGTLPDLNLPHLQVLSLAKNNLSGEIPNFSNLPDLGFLFLPYNNFTGTIPNFSNLPKLAGINLSNNQLSGHLPAFDATLDLFLIYLNNNQLSGGLENLRNRPTLRDLDLSRNQFSGNIPDLSFLYQLDLLRLNFNQFTGPVPSFAYTNELEIIDLSYNQLTGIIPNFDSLSRVKTLNLSYNNLSGSIPRLEQLPALEELILQKNNLTGLIPELSIPTLQSLVLSENNLSGALPTFNNLSNLRTLDLANNQLQGFIPSYDHLNQLRILRLGNNRLTGNIPNFNLPDLRELSLGYNSFNLNLPLFNQLPRLSILNLEGLNLGNELINSISIYPQLNSIDISDNQLSVLPNFPNRLNILDIRHNSLTFEDILPIFNPSRPIGAFFYRQQENIGAPETLFFTPGQSYTLDLEIDKNITSNRYTWYQDENVISSTIGDPQLQLNNIQLINTGTYYCIITNPNAPNLILESEPITINLPAFSCTGDSLALVEFYHATGRANWINTWDLSTPMTEWYGVTLNENGCVVELDMTVRIPSSTGESFTISDNNLVGTLPDLNLPTLNKLILGGNKLTGNIPDFTNLNSIKTIDLSHNQLSGSIPDFSNTTLLRLLNLRGNELEGKLPNFSNTPNLIQIDVNGNNLIGDVPDFSNIPKLNFLNLSNNQLSGNIPNFSSTPELFFLALANNEFIGGIPDFSQLPKLESLNLSYNDINYPLPNFENNPELESLYLNGTGMTDNFFPSAEVLSKLNVIFFEDNLLTRLPDLSAFDNLRHVYFRDNQITEFPRISSELSNLFISHNNLTFEDIIPAINDERLEEVFISYRDQNLVGTPIELTTEERNSYTFELSIDENLANKTYQLYKNQELIATVVGATATHTIENLSINDAGTYHFEITSPDVPSLTLKSHPIVLNINFACTPSRDRENLLSIYEQTNGSNWTNTWDITAPMDTWYGITTNQEGCVTKIDLDGIDNGQHDLNGGGNNLTGHFPNLLFTDLVQLNVANNELTRFDDFSDVNSLQNSANSLIISNNILTFADILPNLPLGLESTAYSPQKKFHQPEMVNLNQGSYYAMVFDIRRAPSNRYHLYKNGNFVVTGTFNGGFVFDEIDEAMEGVYTLQVTNEDIPDLILDSHPITIIVNCVAATINAIQTTYNTATFEVFTPLPLMFRYRPIGTETWKTQEFDGDIDLINLTELNSQTTYEYQINTICPEGEIQWSTSSTFTTTICETLRNNVINNQRDLIPDATGEVLFKKIEISGFPAIATLADVNLEQIFLNIEHSWLRDLEIRLICPNGQELLLHEHSDAPSSRIYLGEPITITSSIGRGYNYFWADNPDLPTWIEWTTTNATSDRTVTLPSGQYSPFESFSKLSNCPVNGTWQLSFEDRENLDNGYVFAWGITFSSADSINSLIFQQPENQTVTIGESLTMSVGEPQLDYSYQWEVTQDNDNFEALIGQINPTLSIPDIALTDDGKIYRCIISNACATTFSNTATLTVLRPTNDNCNPTLDRAALVTFYQNMNGTQWQNTWDLDAPMETWYGVFLTDEGCVQKLDLDGIPNGSMDNTGIGNYVLGNLSLPNLPNLTMLSLANNGLRGSLPDFAPLPALNSLNLRGNQLTESLPDFTSLEHLEVVDLAGNNFEHLPNDLSTLGNLNTLSLTNNNFTFEDLMPLLSNHSINTLTYDNQSIIHLPEYKLSDQNSNISLDLNIDAQVASNVYTWYKNEEVYASFTGINQLNFTDLQRSDSGYYRCEITNPSAPDLTLLTRRIILLVRGDYPIGFTSPLTDDPSTPLHIFPNPTSQHLQVVTPFDTEGQQTFYLISANHQVMQQGTMTNWLEMDLSNLPNGVYWLRVVGQKQTWVEQIVKQ